MAASLSPSPASERIERPQPLRDREVDRHDHDRHDREGGGERDVPGGALVDVDRLADEQAATCRRCRG